MSDKTWTLDDAHRLTTEAWERGAKPRVHPNGFIQLDLTKPESEEWHDGKQKGHSGAGLRLHVWNPPGFAMPHQDTTNEIHDHVFDMRSTVVRGELIQSLYVFVPWNELERDAGPRTHETYKAVYDKKSSSRLDGPLEDGKLYLREQFHVHEGESYTQQAFTLHDSGTSGLTTVTIMEKVAIHEGTPTVVCLIDQPPDNDFDRATAASQEDLWQAINRSLA